MCCADHASGCSAGHFQQEAVYNTCNEILCFRAAEKLNASYGCGAHDGIHGLLSFRGKSMLTTVRRIRGKIIHPQTAPHSQWDKGLEINIFYILMDLMAILLKQSLWLMDY